MSNAQPTHDIYALAAAVRDGELSPEQCEQLVRLLHRIESAYGLAPPAAQRYPDAPERQSAYATAVWEPVAAEYARLLQQWGSNLSHDAAPATREKTALVTDTRVAGPDHEPTGKATVHPSRDTRKRNGERHGLRPRRRHRPATAERRQRRRAPLVHPA